MPAEERALIRAAIVELVGERGYQGMTLAMLLDRAGVDQAAFDRHFTDLPDCFHQVFTELGEEFMLRMAAAFSAESTWREQLRAVAYALLDWLQEDPDRARFTFVEALNAGEPTQLTRDQFFEWLFALIDAGRQELEDPHSLTPTTASAIGGTIFNRIRVEIEAGNVEELDQLAPQLMYAAVLPYLGSEAAREELELPRSDSPPSAL